MTSTARASSIDSNANESGLWKTSAVKVHPFLERAESQRVRHDPHRQRELGQEGEFYEG
jgi:hypothetical protein